MDSKNDDVKVFGTDLIQIPVLIEVEKPALESIGRDAFMELLFKAVTKMKIDDSKVVWGLIEIDPAKSSVVAKDGSLRFQKPDNGG